jgi:hypothetical protein
MLVQLGLTVPITVRLARVMLQLELVEYCMFTAQDI